MWMLVDGNSWFARDFFAQGPTCVGTFLKRLADVRAQLVTRELSRVVICWDSPDCFRKKIDGNYKAHRGEKPAGFHAALSDLRNEVDAMDVESYAVAGFESDDLVATLAMSSRDEGERAILFSSDKDIHQCLVADFVTQCTLVERATRNDLRFQCVSAAALKERYGVAPHQWVDYRVIVGDTSDGLKGCPRVGPKAASAVLGKLDSLDDFFKRPFAAPLTDKQRASLLNFRPEVERLRRLMTLRTDVALPHATEVAQ